MNKSLNVFLSVLLCVVLCVGVISSIQTTDDFSVWSSSRGYSPSAATKSGAVTHIGVGSNGNGLSVPISSRPSRGSVRHLSSHRLVTSSPNSLITYTSSSQTMKSFGGGSNAAGVSMSGGVVSTNSQSPIANSLLALSPNNLTTSSSNNLLALSPNNLITSSPTNLLTSSPNGLIASSTGARGIGGRHNAPGTLGGEDNNYINWLESEYGEGCLTLSEEELRNLYVNLTGDSSFQNEDQWNAFWEWFMGKQSDDSFKWKLPLSDAIPFLLLLAMAYVFYIFFKTRKQILTK